MSLEANQPVGSGGVTQQDKNNAAITQGLVLAIGGIGVLNGLLSLSFSISTLALAGLLGMLSWGAMIGVIVVFFLWKDKGEFMHGHVRQALGLILISIAVGIVMAILGGIVGGTALLVTGRISAAVYLVSFLGLAINAAFGWCGYLGLQAAQKGEPIEYPVVGSFITNFGKK